ncbi:hypothetical protein [Brotaphodocola sp.]|uniref:hypothetical protein n=1 Tax=Brotaphodocola sp. TaxID=3073577 RepID=UPI003D7E50A2
MILPHMGRNYDGKYLAQWIQMQKPRLDRVDERSNQEIKPIYEVSGGIAMEGTAQTIQEQKMLIKEAQMQVDALRRLGNWQRGCLSIAVIGVILAVNGFYMNAGTLRGVFGIILAVLFSAMALVIWTGRKNGKKNVKKILEAAGQPISENL